MLDKILTGIRYTVGVIFFVLFIPFFFGVIVHGYFENEFPKLVDKSTELSDTNKEFVKEICDSIGFIFLILMIIANVVIPVCLFVYLIELPR